MPEISVEVSFEAYCDRCGSGICNNVNTRTSRNRGYPQITIAPCEACISNAVDPIIDEVDNLKNEVDNLNYEVNELKEINIDLKTDIRVANEKINELEERLFNLQQS